MPKKVEAIEYAISRFMARKQWRLIVRVTRRGYRMYRYFSEESYGGRDETLIVARAYRDAVMAAFPPFTNREMARKTLSNNTSGAPGVYALFYKGKQSGWTARLKAPEKVYFQTFSFSKYKSEEEAFNQAVAARAMWVAEMEGKFLAHNADARAVADTHFMELLEQNTDLDWSTEEKFRKRLAEVDALFDAHYPRYFYVLLYIRPQCLAKRPSLILRLTLPDDEKWKEQWEASLHIRSLQEALTVLRHKLACFLIDKYGRTLCQAFMEEYGSLFQTSQDIFDTQKSVRARFPVTLCVSRSTRRGELPFFRRTGKEA